MQFIDPNITRKNAFQDAHLASAGTLPDGSPVFSEIEFNITGLCNRLCVFCPRVDPKVFPNVNEHLAIDLYRKILNDLKDIDYSGRVSFSGFGEPLLHPDHLELIRATREVLPGCWLDIVSNGDRVDAEKMMDLFDSVAILALEDALTPVFEIDLHLLSFVKGINQPLTVQF